jgi:carboxyl-terminal processing protease
VIVSINGRALRGLSYPHAVLLMHGDPGTSVRLAVRRQGVSHPLLLTLVRQPVEMRAVTSKVLKFEGHRYLYLRVPGFVDRTAEAVRRTVQQAHKQGIDRVVLDLRGNLGGLLSQAVAVSQVFVKSGVIVETSGRGGHTAIYSANQTSVPGLKVAVLVDGITASAAEVVAGSVQRAHAGVIVGTRTYGKGTVQSVWPLPGGGALKATVAIFRLAGGVQVNGRGVRPDVVSADRPTTPADETLEAALATLARG